MYDLIVGFNYYTCNNNTKTKTHSQNNYGTVQLPLHIIMHYQVCQHVVIQKELMCLTLCDCMPHVYVQHGHTCPCVAINSTYKAKIVTVSQVA